MKLGRTSRVVLGVGLFVIAVLGLYLVYQGQAGKRQVARDDLTQAQAEQQTLILEKQGLESELGQLEDELAQEQSNIGQLEIEMAQAILALAQTEAGFPGSMGSIEYDEILFGFARDSNLEIVGLSASEPSDISEEDITYFTTSFTVEVRGGVADILDFINAVVTDENFKTAILKPVTIAVPEPLTGAEKDQIKEEIRTKLTAAAIAELTTEDIVGFILEAIAEVTGQQIGTLTVEEMAETIRVKIAGLVEEDFVALLSGDLAKLIEEHIAGLIVDTIVNPLAQEIADLIVARGEEGFLEEDLVALLGEDMAELLGDAIAGGLPGDIAGLLNEYIANLVEEKMVESVAGLVEVVVEELAAARIAELKEPSATITLVIYAYQGE
ncbi:MAG: hypothetical protein V3W01_00950 [Dehalococcoidales bacterium]